MRGPAVKDTKDAMEKGYEAAGSNVDGINVVPTTATDHGTKANHGVAAGVGIGIASLSGTIGLAITIASVAITTLATAIPGGTSLLGILPPTSSHMVTYFGASYTSGGSTNALTGSPSSTINTIQKNCLRTSQCLAMSQTVLNFTHWHSDSPAVAQCIQDLNTDSDYYSECRKTVGMDTHLQSGGSITRADLNGDCCNKPSFGCVATAVVFELKCENYPDIQGFAGCVLDDGVSQHQAVQDGKARFLSHSGNQVGNLES
ncbi:hypothetical protein HDU76_007647 [Blyttiomyces sp. JEL0837]|nr:hypothetical protein HDU76_007647 [Blyttiomyces sp. JEL0837]